MGNIIVQINLMYSGMHPSEKKIAKYILDHETQVPFMSVNDLAHNSSVSEASVIRFVKKLGLSSYVHLKLALASVPTESIQNTPPVLPHYSISTKEYIRDNMICSIKDTAEMLKNKDIEKAVDLICKADRIFFLASGPCSVACILLEFHLTELGFKVFYSSDIVMQIQTLSFSTTADAAIAVSHGGKTPSTLRLLKIAKANHTPLIFITNNMKSSIIGTDDVQLCSYTKIKEHEFFDGFCQSAQIFIVETLVAFIRLKMGITSEEKRRQVAQNTGIEYGTTPESKVANT